MAGFRKAKTEQAALKLGMYGLAGSGKTFTALLMAEGLAKISGKRIAYIDTERGTDFYCIPVKDRSFHPEAFDFDALYTRSITEVLTEVKKLDPAKYAVVIVDSITHLWEAVRNAYAGKLTKAGTIPFHAWGGIKRPYKELINFLLNSPIHVIICGRQGNEFAEDPETEELKRIGVKMKAEGETPYEPHILIQMEAVKNPKDKQATITAYAEKDRSGVLAGKVIAWPNFDNMIKPLLPYLKADHQAHMPDADEVGGVDAEKLAEQDKARIKESERLLGQYTARIQLANSAEELEAIGKELTAEVKKHFIQADLGTLREAYLAKQETLPQIIKADRKQRSDKGMPRKETPVESALPTVTSPEAGEATIDPEPIGNHGDNGNKLVDSDTVDEILIYCNLLGENPNDIPKRFGVNKLSELTSSEAGKVLGELLDRVSALEK
jgi:hypothetical protein